MNNTGKDTEATREAEDPESNAPGPQPGKKDSLKKNPNPRANENLPEELQEKKGDKKLEQGPGSEITDGEDG